MTVMTAPLACAGDTTSSSSSSFQNVTQPASLRSFVDPLDADPAMIDGLTDDDDDEDDQENADDRYAGSGFGENVESPRGGESCDEPRLFTAMVVANDGFEILQAFHASLATEEAEIAGRLYMRMGAAMADAVIVDGFDPTAPPVAALVSRDLRHAGAGRRRSRGRSRPRQPARAGRVRGRCLLLAVLSMPAGSDRDDDRGTALEGRSYVKT